MVLIGLPQALQKKFENYARAESDDDVGGLFFFFRFDPF